MTTPGAAAAEASWPDLPPQAAAGGPALVTADGQVIELAVDRWRRQPDEAELGLLATVPDPVLDVGCGPGRIVGALATRGRVALGLDTSPLAVEEAGRHQVPVLQRSVFGPLPGEGRWGTVVLLDGNVGIGGDPLRLLRRSADLVRPGGQVLVELDPPGTPTEAVTVRVRSPQGHGPWFPWARAGVDGVPRLALAAGLGVSRCAARGGRWFGWLVKR